MDLEMESNLVDCETTERDPCGCKGGTLAILKEVQRGYEERMALVERIGGGKKLQMQVEVLRSWVGDLVGQNALLARAVEELEAEATSRLLLERKKHAEIALELRAEAAALRRRAARARADARGLVEVLRRLRDFDSCTLDGIHFYDVTESDIFGTVEWRQKKLETGETKRRIKQDFEGIGDYRHFTLDETRNISGNATELKILNDSLQKETIDKDKEIKRLNKDVQKYQQTIINLRQQISLGSQCSQSAPKKDAEVMAGMCYTGNEYGDWEPVRECSADLREEARDDQKRLLKMEATLKASNENVRALREMNVDLSKELHDAKRFCAVLNEQCCAATMRTQFKEDIIRELRRQLMQAKNKLRELSDTKNTKKDYDDRNGRSAVSSYESVSVVCVRQQPRRRGLAGDSSGGDSLSATLD